MKLSPSKIVTVFALMFLGVVIFASFYFESKTDPKSSDDFTISTNTVEIGGKIYSANQSRYREIDCLDLGQGYQLRITAWIGENTSGEQAKCTKWHAEKDGKKIRDLSMFYFEYEGHIEDFAIFKSCLLYTSPSPRDQRGSRMPSSA